MCSDWHLRDATAHTRGGIPDQITTLFRISSLLVFGVATYRLSPAQWHGFIRTFSALLQVTVELCLMLYAWLHYVISHGIDAL